MSTFAVFGMTRDVALAMAKKEVKSVRKTLECRDMQIRAKVQLWNEDGTPVLTKKRKHKVEWQQFGHQPGRAAA
ncbi:TPA: hypothetical protein ACF3X4_005792 [Pseudomonas aeruginosa]|uniref:hypothetical protein n=1 Tax=Pseudomonas aeruginosa TaxID=287 RepID=UPI001A2FF89B|nr:hypothetical protein [Pseudomonas aeruginosa]MBH3704371.1 hypothetical protein [Pseudomonas aeruginosa]MBI7059674.1 hypothetical protein [Pseudomonas aeruginosa]MBI8620139.1 hypothetical protein [Pseudomonas aeruginosa]MDY1086675.1 hypothetical protein [Pseudomonas aeruginosa]HCF7516605.1 hypothetical protein [Pseudomonas aeruginosa]